MVPDAESLFSFSVSCCWCRLIFMFAPLHTQPSENVISSRRNKEKCQNGICFLRENNNKNSKTRETDAQSVGSSFWEWRGSVGKTTKEEDMRFSPFFKASPMYKILCCLPSVETGSVNQFETTKKLWWKGGKGITIVSTHIDLFLQTSFSSFPAIQFIVSFIQPPKVFCFFVSSLFPWFFALDIPLHRVRPRTMSFKWEAIDIFSPSLYVYMIFKKERREKRWWLTLPDERWWIDLWLSTIPEFLFLVSQQSHPIKFQGYKKPLCLCRKDTHKRWKEKSLYYDTTFQAATDENPLLLWKKSAQSLRSYRV